MKTCSRCRTTKPLTGFHRDKYNADGRRAECADCHNASVVQRGRAIRSAWAALPEGSGCAYAKCKRAIDNHEFRLCARHVHLVMSAKESPAVLRGGQWVNRGGVRVWVPKEAAA